MDPQVILLPTGKAVCESQEMKLQEEFDQRVALAVEKQVALAVEKQVALIQARLLVHTQGQGGQVVKVV